MVIYRASFAMPSERQGLKVAYLERRAVVLDGLDKRLGINEALGAATAAVVVVAAAVAVLL